MVRRLKITVYGRVQRVGYRDYVAEIARQLGIGGTVKNLDDGVSVEVIAEGEEKLISEFLKKIDITDYPISVEKIDFKEEKPANEFKHFKIQRGDPMEEIGERMDAAAYLLYSMNKKQDENTGVLKKFSEETHASFDLMEKKYGAISEKLGKLDKMADSFDELVEILRMFKPKE